MDKVMDYSERYILTRLYMSLFCSPSTTDEEQDLKTQKRIRSLHWVTTSMLDTVINENDPAIRHELDSAITGVVIPLQNYVQNILLVVLSQLIIIALRDLSFNDSVEKFPFCYTCSITG